MENILVIRLKAIGDVIFTLPAVNALRGHFPTARITFLTSRENAPLLQGFPEVNETIELDRAALRSGQPVKVAREFFGLLWRLRARRFTVAVDFQGFGETAWLARLTGASQRWGSVYGKGRQWAYTRGLIRDDRLHPADWNLELLARCGVNSGPVTNRFALPPASLAAARSVFAGCAMDPSRPTLAIQPVTSTPQKNWPMENFLAVARHWRTAGVQVIFLGGPADGPGLEPARQEQFCVATDLPLLVSAGVVALSTLTLGGDSGLGHLAVAMGRRVVMLMMNTRPGACVPYLHPNWTVAPATPGRIAEITVATVVAETARVLAPD